MIGPTAVSLQQDFANAIVGTNHEPSETVHAYHLRWYILYSKFWMAPGGNCEAPARLRSAPAISHDLSTFGGFLHGVRRPKALLQLL